VRLTIRSKLVLFTVLPVTAVFSALFWLGISHVRDHVTENARQWLAEHTNHQAAQLALKLAQVPLLAQSLGDIVLTEHSKPQTLMYAHLIDGLRRTPIARTAAVAYGSPQRGALMRRGAPAGRPLLETELNDTPRRAGWHVRGENIRFNRPVYRAGERVADTWVELAIADVYEEIGQLRSGPVTLFLNREDGTLLPPTGLTPDVRALATSIPRDADAGTISTVANQDNYWVVSTDLPDLPWRVTAVTPTSTALEPAWREASWVAAALLLALLMIVAIIGTVARQITRPLATLNASVDEIAKGNFAVAPEVRSGDELGGLAKAIRLMARHIANREGQLHSSYQVMEQRVAERTAALQESNARLLRQIEETRATEEALRVANEQALRANRAKSEFLSNMSHELRTPLHGVLGYAQILQRDPTTSPGQRENLEAIERCGQHLLTLINDILDLTKIEAGQMELDFQPTDFQQLLGDVRTIVVQRADSKGLEMRLKLAPELPAAIITDAVKLKQILLNLLGNAIKFTKQGSVTLRVEEAPDDHLLFEVTDTGVGIPADKIGAIFDPFHQARDGQAIDGTGLGLAINRRLIQLLGGESLAVDSEPGVGSRFRFRIPYQKAEPESLEDLAFSDDGKAGRLRLAPGNSCRVMVIDRLPENRNVLTTLLRYADCEVEPISDAMAATGRLREAPFDLVLMDVREINQGVADTVRALHDSTAPGSPRIVAVSANVFPGAEDIAETVGFDGFLGKPFGEEQLFGLITRLLDVTFEARPAQQEIPFNDQPAWPEQLARDTARRIRAAIDLGDVASLFQLAEELSVNKAVPSTDAENIALMTRLFDFDGLRRFSERLQTAS